MSSTPGSDRRTRPFASFLMEHNRGAGHLKAGEALQDVVAAVMETGKKGSVTLTVSVEPVKNNDEVLQTIVTVASKVPTMPEKAAMFYADGDNNLQREDPKQEAFEGLREAERPEVRVADAPEGESAVRTAAVAGVR